MKTLSAVTLFLLVTLAGPVLSETLVKATPADGCPLAGVQPEPAENCTALRSAYRAEISDCMDQMKSEADARAGKPTANSSHSSRARFLICDASVRQKLAVLSD